MYCLYATKAVPLHQISKTTAVKGINDIEDLVAVGIREPQQQEQIICQLEQLANLIIKNINNF